MQGAMVGGPLGLTAAAGGLRLALLPGRTPLRFRILDAGGAAVTDFDVQHAKRLHLIVARRDLTGFQHLHPQMAADGTWSTALDLPEAGAYRLLADVVVAGRKVVLGSDLQVPGRYEPRALPAPSDVAPDDHGLTVRRTRAADGSWAFSVTDARGRSKDLELEPYLGAKGHLVSLRLGDLAYAHTHPQADRLAFHAELPGPGRYRSWVQFQLAGAVHTAAFTDVVR